MGQCSTLQERGAAVKAIPVTSLLELRDKVRELWRIGKLLIQKKELSAALSLFSESIVLGKMWIDGVHEEGPAYWGEGVYNMFHNSIGVDRIDLAVYATFAVRWWLNVIVQSLQQQESQLTRQEFTKRAVEVKVLNGRYIQRLEEVTQNFADAKDRFPQLCVIWITLAEHYSSIRNDEQALKALEKAVACNPSSQAAQLRLAVASLSVKKTEDALHCFERCVPISLKDDFELAPISAGLAYCMWQLKQATTDQILQVAREARRIDLLYEESGRLQFQNNNPEVFDLYWKPLIKELAPHALKAGRCGWCLVPEATKRCSKCTVAVYCSMDCFKKAWKGDEVFVSHKSVCAEPKK